MDEELKMGLYTVIELLVFAVLVLIIAQFGKVSRESFVIKQTQDLSRTELVEFRKVYEFSLGKIINKEQIEKDVGKAPYSSISIDYISKNGNIVTGDDIIRLVGLYPYEYTIYIQGKSKNLELTPESSKEDWSITEISNWFGEDVTHEYYCLFIYDELKYGFDSVIFKYKT